MKPIAKMGLGMAVAAAVLVGAEAALRALDLPDPGLYAGDLSSVWTLRPDLAPREIPFPEEGTSFTVRTNSIGFRGPEAPRGAVVVLGDSTTFGWGVEEDEAWPAQLAQLTGLPVVNGGVPGYSTAQGRATLSTTIALKPAVVILAYLVRDAQRAPQPDDVTVIHPVESQPRLFQLLRRSVAAPGPTTTGTSDRVPPSIFATNVQAMDTTLRLLGAVVLHVAFPMREEPMAHLAAWRGVAPDLIVPSVPASQFTRDGIHLSPAGNRTLAEAVAPLLPRDLAPPPAPIPDLPAPILTIPAPTMPDPTLPTPPETLQPAHVTGG